MKRKTLLIVAAFTAALLAGNANMLVAQPVLNFSRVVNNWPTIELYFKVACDGAPAYPDSRQFFKVFENNVEVEDFTLWCPDPRQRCAISVALVFDASGSMGGSGNAGAKAAGNRFVDLMDGIVDEAAVIWFTSAVTVFQQMTTDKNDLHNAVNSLPASGATAVWDGIYAGVEEVVASGSNPCRAVIAVTDGNDNSSAHTPDDIIALANRNRIRVFTIGLGSVSPAQLETIALLTGGRYYQAPSPSQLVAIYTEISTIIYAAFLECLITYQAECTDGGLRTVDLTLQDFCGGSNTKSRTYRAPKDTSLYTDTEIEIGSMAAIAGRPVMLPLMLNTPLDTNQIIYPATFTVLFNQSDLAFQRVSTPPGTIWENVSVTVDPIIGGIRIRTSDRTVRGDRDVFGYLVFVPQQVQDTVYTDVDLATWAFEAGCLNPVLGDGEVVILDSSAPHIYPGGTVTICEGDSVTLTAIDGFTDYLWSTADTGRSITVHSGGSYWVSAENQGGIRDTSGVVVVNEVALPRPALTPSNDTAICFGQSLILSAPPGYQAYEWSNGKTMREITVTEQDTYRVRVQNESGCWGYSNDVHVTVRALPNASITGRTQICRVGGALYTYYVSSHPDYTSVWTVDGGVPYSGTTGDTLIVRWPDEGSGSITVTRTDMLTGCVGMETIAVERTDATLTLSHNADTTLCRGSILPVAVNETFDGYQWSTGETTPDIRITESGDYWVTATVDQCTAASDTFSVTVLDDIPVDITGDLVVCQGDLGTYSVQAYPGTNYAWSVHGGTVGGGDGTPQATIRWTMPGTGFLVVEASLGPCRTTDTITVDVQSTEKPQIELSGDTLLCDNETLTMRAPDGYATYEWTTGETTQEIAVTTEGSYAVTVTTPHGCTAQSDIVGVTVIPAPEKPVITQSGNTLTCSVIGSNYVWYLDGQVIQGENNRTLVATQEGRYTVKVVALNGCSNISDPLVYGSTGRYAPGLARSFEVTPNPTDGVFTVALEFAQPAAFTMRLVNVAGQTVYERQVTQPVVEFRESVQLQQAAPGMYFFILESGGAYDFRKLVVR